MKETSKTDYSDLENYAESLGLTADEYALSLHEKNKNTKAILLDNGSDFKSFISEYHSMLDSFTEYKDFDAKKNTDEHYTMVKAVHEIITSISRDPKLLAQLYHHFPNGLSSDGESFNLES